MKFSKRFKAASWAGGGAGVGGTALGTVTHLGGIGIAAAGTAFGLPALGVVATGAAVGAAVGLAGWAVCHLVHKEPKQDGSSSEKS